MITQSLTEHESHCFALLSLPPLRLHLEGCPGTAKLLCQIMLLREQLTNAGLTFDPFLPLPLLQLFLRTNVIADVKVVQ